MLFISDRNLISFSEAEEKFNFEKLLNEKKYRVSDTPLTYRQVNSLGSGKIIKDDRENERGWRKFSLKELIFFKIIMALRQYGLKNEQLANLRNSFFAEPKKTSSPITQVNRRISDVAIGLTFSHQQIILTINEENSAYYYDMMHFALLNEDSRSFIYLNLNKIVNEVLTSLGIKEMEYQSLLDELLSRHKPTKKENELLGIIRNNDYSVIKIKKRNGEIENVYGEAVGEASGLSEEGLLQLLKAKNFRNISIQRRDGKVVSYKVEDIYKV